MSTAAIAISEGECSAAFEGTSWFRSGTEFLQHASEFAVGAQCPFRQQSATWLLEAPAEKQSKGPRRRTTTIRLTTM
jgi:hypothetical protein